MSDQDEEPAVEAANGSFYPAYKDGLETFLLFVEQVGKDGASSGKLLAEDLYAVERGLSTLSSKREDLSKLLAKIIDEKEPSFWDECVFEHIWSLLGATFLIGQHSGITKSAKAFVGVSQSEIARSVKKQKDFERSEKQKEVLRRVLGNCDWSKPYKLAESIFREPTERAKLASAAKEIGISDFSESTARRLLIEMRDHS